MKFFKSFKYQVINTCFQLSVFGLQFKKIQDIKLETRNP